MMTGVQLVYNSCAVAVSVLALSRCFGQSLQGGRFLNNVVKKVVQSAHYLRFPLSMLPAVHDTVA